MSKTKKRSNTIIFALIGLIAILVAVVIWRNQSKPKGEKVITEQAEKRTIVEEVSASGKVFPQTEVKISSDVSGEIVDLLIEEGDSVVSGQLLARIDPDAFESQVERGAASVNSAKAQLANARAQIEQFTAQKEQIEAQLINAREIQDRNKPLYEDGVISEADYQQSLANLRALEANLRSAEANVKAAKQSAEAAAYTVQSSEASLKELKTSLRRTEIFAPMSGIISRLDVEEGERVVGTIQMAGTEMMRIANLNAMEVRVEVSENDIPRVTVGDEVAIEVDAYIDRVFKGKVTQIANSATNAASAASLTSDQVTNFEVRINIDPASYDDLITPSKPYPFRPGMSASVDIRTEVANGVLSIPIQAVTTREREDDEKPEAKPAALEEEEQDLMEVVFVASIDTVRMQKVKTGVQDDTYIEVVEGLKEGDEVVTGPYAAVARKLKSGEKIQVVDEDELYKRDND
ncbi:efflux RND transporter periplasmic adaptor subunit [Phaeodactylibacter sp.]|jgi:HlyD family secretion protein|uniref:efflux RND transporter periplasmic adaptor subunit n=1 Tax=Phaeodactylibacter sp. TaxID=1940289 RepID=UPI0025DE8B04|nr:efflux RND transporter periplasmic adaptor subunit [Phaeodactylibacter sp.]MCI4651001.1 efflux RND transporter periplasmic adaptor subunit [Phaeodactylibacter sp.]MCI5089634.1 efflux RND transporter periplasmic adaptor subunit [Phaeodactylibacter sp.]